MADQQQKTKGVVDIVFLIDSTGSMAPCIDALKQNIELFIDKLTATDANNTCIVKDWRAKIVGYRDFEETDVPPFIDNPFVTEDTTLKSQLSTLEAIGGGDEPESLLDALFKVATMGNSDKDAEADPNKWRYRSAAARVVIVFTDASYKETMSIPEAAGGTLDDLINKIHENRIILPLFAPDMECYNLLSEADKAEYEPIDIPVGSTPQAALAAFTADEANFRATLEALAKSVSKSSDTTAL